MRWWLGLLILLGPLAVGQNQSIEELRQRSYGGGQLVIERTMSQNPGFTRYLVRWPSEGLTQYGFMNVPKGEGTYPVVFVLHGYVNPYTYRTLAYTTRYADAITRMGYVVIHPNYRGHPPSQGSPEPPFRINYAIDVLNLAAIVRQQSGQAPLQKADGSRIGLWGHSMGGGSALRVATIDPKIKAVLLYGSMSGDERKNAGQIYYVFSRQTRGYQELNASDTVIRAVSPIYYLQGIRAAFSVHHGTADEQVPYAWSVELCQKLKALGKSAECFSYRGARHTFTGASDQIFLSRVRDFFARTLK